MKRNTSMGCFSMLGLLMFMAAINAGVANSKEFAVGGSGGWRQPSDNTTEMYTHWAAKRRFHIGDSLRFNYKNDSVLEVDKRAFYHCMTSNPIATFEDGNSVVNLNKPGPVYFISGDLEHCKNGQRLEIDVIHPKSPSSIGGPPAASPSPNSGASVSVRAFSFSMALVASSITYHLCGS